MGEIPPHLGHWTNGTLKGITSREFILDVEKWEGAEGRTCSKEKTPTPNSELLDSFGVNEMEIYLRRLVLSSNLMTCDLRIVGYNCCYKFGFP